MGLGRTAQPPRLFAIVSSPEPFATSSNIPPPHYQSHPTSLSGLFHYGSVSISVRAAKRLPAPTRLHRSLGVAHSRRDARNLSSMLQQGVLLAWTAMAAGVKAVSKRLGRMYVEDEGEAEKDASRYQPKKAPVYDDPEVGSATRKQSISTATSQSSLSSQSSRQTSLEAAPLVATEKVDLTTRTTSPESFGHGIYGSRAEVVDMFGSVQGFAAFTNPGPDVTLPAGRPIDCFGTVVPGVYRSSFPQAEDYAFMEALKLKTVVYAASSHSPPLMLLMNILQDAGAERFSCRVPRIYEQERDKAPCLRHEGHEERGYPYQDHEVDSQARPRPPEPSRTDSLQPRSSKFPCHRDGH